MDRMKKIIYSSVGVLLLLIISFSYYFNAIGTSNIYKGVTVDNIKVSGMTKNEALNLLNDSLKDFENKNLQFKLNDTTYTRSLKDLGYEKNFKESVEKAFNVGRDKSHFQNFLRVVTLPIFGKNIETVSSFSDAKVQETVNFLVDKVYIKSQDAAISYKDGKFIKNKEVVGRYLKTDTLADDIKKDAKSLKPIELTALPIEPKVKESYFDGIDAVLGDFSTNYKSSEENRKHNIALGAKKISGIFVNPGTEISFNDTIGNMDEAAGFKSAGVIINGEFDRGWGGGICQVSTTLYNALVKSDIEITERSNHSRPIGYVERGTDAAVAPGYKDLKFKNNLSHKIFIDSKADGENIEFVVYGNKLDKEFEINLISELLEVKDPNKITKYSDELDEGEVKVESEGKKGYDYASYKEYLKDGQVVKKEKYLNSHYIPKDRVVIIGEKKSEMIASKNSKNSVEDKTEKKRKIKNSENREEKGDKKNKREEKKSASKKSDSIEKTKKNKKKN